MLERTTPLRVTPQGQNGRSAAPAVPGQGFEVSPTIGPQGMIVMMLDTLEQMLDRLERIETSINADRAEGKALNFNYTLTDGVLSTVLEPGMMPKPFIAIVVVNDGPGSVDYWVNDPTSPQPGRLNSGESQTLDFKNKVVQELYLRLVSGASATGRVVGTY